MPQGRAPGAADTALALRRCGRVVASLAVLAAAVVAGGSGMTPRIHGGTDALGPVRLDFSSNANACGPCPMALQAVQGADAAHYPDPTYTRLRSALADLHGVASARVLLAASASECIQRLTAWRWRAGDRRFWTPPHAYWRLRPRRFGLGAGTGGRAWAGATGLAL